MADSTAWKSASGSTSSSSVIRRKKKPLTLEERRQQMKGLSKAFISSGTGWAKVDPVLVAEKQDDSDDSDHSDHSPEVIEDDYQQEEESDHLDDEDVMAMMRQQIQQMKAANKTTSPPKSPDYPPATSTSTPTYSASTPPKPRHSPPPQQPYPTTNSPVPTTWQTPDPSVDNIPTLRRLLDLVEKKGLEEAWTWARDQVTQTGTPDRWSQPSFPLSTPQPWSAPVLLPKPLRQASNGSTRAVNMERHFYRYYRQAVEATAFEYMSQSSSTMFIVRRPYGMDDPARNELWKGLGATPPDPYHRRAHVSDRSTIEVAVVIKPNNGVLLVIGADDAKFRGGKGELQKQEAASFAQMGNITYRNEHGTLATISLDDLYQEALLVRDHFAVTVTALAISLKNLPDPAPAFPALPTPKASRTVAVNTDGDFMTNTESSNRNTYVVKQRVSRSPQSTRQLTTRWVSKHWMSLSFLLTVSSLVLCYALLGKETMQIWQQTYLG